MSKPTKAQNPDMDFGFYAGIPRIVRTGYKDVSAVQKWLYVCLKDLAGDDGTCYRTIRALVEETGLSAGMISESILVLHKTGLIHAEKKKRSTGGKEVWHISIVDIWKKNGEAHPTKRSPTEQTTPYIDVHTANVHHTNDKPVECSRGEQKRSQDEQECSRGETEVITITRPVSKNNIEARTEGTYISGSMDNFAQSGTDVPTPAPDASDSYSLNHTEDSSHGTTDGSGNHLHRDRASDSVGAGEHPQSSAGHTKHDVQLQSTGTDTTPSAGRSERGTESTRTRTTGNGVAPLPAGEGGYTQDSARRAPVDVTTLTIKAHVNYVFKWLDAVRQKAEENPQASYVQNGTAEKLVRDLINATMNTPNELTERNVHIAWMAMWKSPAGRDGFTWGEPGKISIAAFCRNYGEYLARGRDSLAKKERRSTPSSVPVVGVSGRRNLNISAPVAR